MPSVTTRSRRNLRTGAVVRCRTRRCLVEDMQPAREPGADAVVTMACMEDQAIGQHLAVFLEREIDFEVLGESGWVVDVQALLPQLHLQQQIPQVFLICSQRRSVTGAHSASIPMSGTPDSLLTFCTQRDLMIL